MAKKTIPENYKATCLPTFLTPPLHQSIDEEGNFVYTESSIKKGLQLRNTEVIETWQATFDYIIVPDQSLYCNKDTSIGPIHLSLWEVLLAYAEADEELDEANRIGGIKLSNERGTVAVVINFQTLTYEAVMQLHQKDFGYVSTGMESPFITSNHRCKAEAVGDEIIPECPRISPLVTIGTIESKIIQILLSHIEPEAVKDNLFTSIDDSIIDQAIIDSKELLTIQKSQITNSTIIARNLQMHNFSLGSGIEFDSQGLFYISGVRRFFVEEEASTSAGDDEADLSLTYAIDNSPQLPTINDMAGLVDSVITQGPSGVGVIYNSVISGVEIHSSEFYCSGNSRFEDSTIFLGNKENQNASGISEQMKVYASPFQFDAPDIPIQRINNRSIDGRLMGGGPARDFFHTANMGYKAISGYGMGDRYFCEAFECPEMFVDPENQNVSLAGSDVINYDMCVNPLTLSGCAEYKRVFGINPFRDAAAKLIGSSVVTVEYEPNPTPSKGQYNMSPTAETAKKPIEDRVNATYMSPSEPLIVEQKILHGIEDTIATDSNITADADIYIKDLQLKGRSKLFFNKNTMFKDTVTIFNNSRLTTKYMSGVNQREGSNTITVNFGGQLDLDFFSSYNSNLYTNGTVNMHLQTFFPENLITFSDGELNWKRPLVNFQHKNTTQYGEINFNTAAFRYGGTFPYNGARLIGTTLQQASGNLHQITVDLSNSGLIDVSNIYLAATGAGMRGGIFYARDFLYNKNSIIKADKISLKGRSTFEVRNGLVLAESIEVDSVESGVLRLLGNADVFDGEGKETGPTPGMPEGSENYAAPTRINATEIKANFIDFGEKVVVTGNILIQSGAPPENFGRDQLHPSSSAYLKIDDISLHAPAWDAYYGILGGHVESRKLKLTNYLLTAAVSGGAEVELIASNNSTSLMNSTTTLSNRTINQGHVNNATFSTQSATNNFAANSDFTDSYIQRTLSGNITATDCKDYSTNALDYLDTPALVGGRSGPLYLERSNIDFDRCNFSFNQLVDTYFSYTFFGTEGIDIYRTEVNALGNEESGYVFSYEDVFVERRLTPRTFTFEASSLSEANSLLGQSIDNVDQSQFPPKSNWGWTHDSTTINPVSLVNISNTQIQMATTIGGGTARINVAALNINENSFVNMNQLGDNMGATSHATMTFEDDITFNTPFLNGPNSSIRRTVLTSGIQVPEFCYLYKCKTQGVDVKQYGATYASVIKYGKYQGLNAFRWQGQSIDYVEPVDINTGELKRPLDEDPPPEIFGSNPIQGSIGTPNSEEALGAENLIHPVNANIQQLRRYTDEAVYTNPRLLRYTNLHYTPEQNLTKITMPVRFVDLRQSYNKKIGYKDRIIDGNTAKPIGEIIGANKSLNQIYISGHIQDVLNSLSGIPSSISSGIPTNSGAIALSINPFLQFQSKSGGRRTGSIGGTINANESIEIETDLPPDKTFKTFTTKNVDKKVIISNYAEAQATALHQAAQLSVTTASVSNAQTPIQKVIFAFSSSADVIGDGEFNNVNIASAVLGSLDINKPTVFNQCGGYFNLGSDSENTYLRFDKSLAWSMTMTDRARVTFDNKSYLATEFGVGVPGTLIFTKGSTNNSRLYMENGSVTFADSFNNGTIGGSVTTSALGGLSFYSSTNVGDIETQSMIFSNSTNLGSIINSSTELNRTKFTKITNLGKISSNYIDIFGMNEGITPYLASVTGLSPSGLAGYFKLKIGATPASPSLDDAGLYYRSTDYTITSLIRSSSNTIAQIGPLPASTYFEPDSFIAQQFLLPFSGAEYIVPSFAQDQNTVGAAYNTLGGPPIYIHIGEEAFFYPQ